MLDGVEQAFLSHGDFDDVSVVKDVWMVHFTTKEASPMIVAAGFQQGTPLNGRLAHCFGAQSHVPGVNFAFLSDDEYAIMSMSGFDFGISVDSAVVFRGDAVRMHHYDDFYQVAFWGPSIQGPIHHLVSTQAADEDDLGLESVEPHEQVWRWEGRGLEGGLFNLLTLIEQDQAPAPVSVRTPKP